VTVSPHLRGIVLASALATLALALGFVTLAMNQSASKTATHKILSLKERHLLATGSKTKAHVKPAPVDPQQVQHRCMKVGDIVAVIKRVVAELVVTRRRVVDGDRRRDDEEAHHEGRHHDRQRRDAYQGEARHRGTPSAPHQESDRGECRLLMSGSMT